MDFFRSLPVGVRDACWRDLREGMEDVFRGVFDNSMPLDEYLEVMWQSWIDVYDNLETDLVELASAIVPNAIDQFHRFYGRDPKDPYPADPIDLLRTDPEFSTYVETEETVRAREDGKRISRAPDFCYVCGKPLGSGRAELLLRWEVPQPLQQRTKWGGDVKWMVRCLSGPCADASNGKRIPLRHPENGDMRNRAAEECVICKVPVAVGAGFLVPRDRIPRWLWHRRAFPGAKEKRYYVVCGKQDRID